ncbi:MAG: esterase [Bryobacterales bacterium]|nr:esterase [Bryobacterales bacterium]
MKSVLPILALAFGLVSVGSGQNLQDTLVSPEVHSDGRITFRLWAPKVAEASLQGDWMAANTREKMTKDDRGVWSITVGPLPPQVYLYTFQIDGLSIADPINPRMKLRARTSASLVEVPGEELWQFRDVPHGRVEIHYHRSAVLGGAQRQVFVYTPPGYGKDVRTRYPVLYLFHGSNDVAAGWTFTGNANLILDNLIAEKRAVPMLIVMPWGHALPFGSAPEVQSRNTELFEKYLITEVMPMVESSYRTVASAQGRAIAGLSMGGGQALTVGLHHLEKFSGIAVFSSGKPRNFEEQFGKVLAEPARINRQLKVFWIGVGRQDAVLESNRALRKTLESNSIRITAVESEGGHVYPVWRRYLSELAPLLFR